MRVGDHILNCSIAIGHKRDGQAFVTYGTAFVFAVYRQSLAFSYLITARHVIEKIPGDSVWIRGNWTPHGGRAMSLPMEKDRFKFHPEHDPDKAQFIDIAVAYIRSERLFELTWLCEDDYLTDDIVDSENISVGDEVITVGMFYTKEGEERIMPKVRVGNIAAMPKEPLPTAHGFMDGLLIETKSISGLSGSPVMVHKSLRPDIERRGLPTVPDKGRHYLAGLMQGYYPAMDAGEAIGRADKVGDRFMNAGIAFVTPVKRIWETLARDDFEEFREVWSGVKRPRQPEGRRGVTEIGESGL